MKVLYIEDVFKKIQTGEKLKISGWIKAKRHLGGIIFLEVEDSTGSIEIVVEKKYIGINDFHIISKISLESCIEIHGKIEKKFRNNQKKIIANKIIIISKATLNISPFPRNNSLNVFDKKHADFIFKNRHLFLRNSKIRAVIRIKSVLLEALREWFKTQKFTGIDTPILTQSTLYRDADTFNTDYFGTKVYLSQCAGLYLEAALPSFERVYTITPAFRAEPSRSPRHNPEFWHAKAQIAFCNLDEIMKFTENMLYYIANYINKECQDDLKVLNVVIDIPSLKPPYPRVSYTDALNILKENGLHLKWGKSLNEEAEKIISNKFKKPVYVTGMPRSVEPFPYMVDPQNSDITKTADLIANDGYGEILGVAEFIYEFDSLISRLKECGKYSQIKRFKWYLELKQYGSVPHSGFGMGIERVLRWLLKLPHIRDTFPFPRLYNRLPYP